LRSQVIKRIAAERARIDGYRFPLGASKFFNGRQYREDFEWLILSYLTGALEAAGWETPEYAQKLDPPEPDFMVFVNPSVPYRRVEVSEVLRPDYRRAEFHREAARRGQKIYQIPPPHPQPWSSFCHVLRSKLRKQYAAGSWLLIYHDMPASEFPDYAPWHERILRELGSWKYDSANTCDITRSRYENIFVVDASVDGAVRLHPHWDVIRESPFPV
jgi:hypothetical protein